MFCNQEHIDTEHYDMKTDFVFVVKEAKNKADRTQWMLIINIECSHYYGVH